MAHTTAANASRSRTARNPSGRIRGDRRASERFVIAMGRALHGAGAPAHRLEEAMERLTGTLGLEGQFFSTPTAIFASFGRKEQRTLLIRVEPGSVDLERLTALDQVLERVLSGEDRPSEANRAVARIIGARNRFGPTLTIASSALVSAAAARFLDGGLYDLAAAAVAGLVAGILATSAERWPTTGRLLYPIVGLAVALFATATAHAFPISAYVVTLAGLIAMLPGMTLTIAMTELATGHLVSGGARLAGALLAFLTLAFGVGLGRRLVVAGLGVVPEAPPTALPGWTAGLALVVVSLAFVVQFRAHPRDVGWLFLAGATAYPGGLLGSRLLGAELGAFVGAVLIGVASHIVARLAGRPAALVQLPGLMLLVPGSLGFRSVSSLMAHDALSGVEAAFSMALVAIALVTGLLVANVLLPPRRLV